MTIIHRPSVTMEPESNEAKAWEEYAEIVVAKSRSRGKGHERVAFRGKHYRFEPPTEVDVQAWRRAQEQFGGDGVKAKRRSA